jgi:phosphate transport system substrate-binding protein
MQYRLIRTLAVGGALVALGVTGCYSRNENAIKVTGSDTMVNLAQAWAESFRSTHPDISPQIKGGGSGVGIAALCAGKIDIATASRPMKPKEIELAKANTGKEPKQIIVGRDALAIYVHKDNPIETISLEELAEIYGAGGKFTKWDQLGVDNKACQGHEIIRVSRQNSSGTYAYFREHVLGEKREYKQGATSQSGSSDVVALVSKTPCAIGYSGMGYDNDQVKIVNVSRRKGEPGVTPSIETALDNSYPISRPLYLYTLGEPSGAVQEFIAWILSDEGQEIIERNGYVPLAKERPAAG